MAVSAADRAALQEQWEGTEAASGFAVSDVPDGNYEFVITKAEPNLKKLGLRITYKIVGGNDQFLDSEITVQDNLDTSDNMGWFKQRLKRLGVDPADYTDLDQVLASSDEAGSVGAALVGKKFDGLKKSKGGFDNVYVNKLLGEEEVSTPEEPAAEAAGGEAAEGGLQEGAEVSFTSKKDGEQVGVVKELFDDPETGDHRVKVYVEANGKTYNLPLENVVATAAPEEAAAPEEKEEVEETEEAEKPKAATKPAAVKKQPIPAYAKVAQLRMPDIKALLAGYGVKAESIAKPREFAQGVAGFVKGGAKYTPSIPELSALCAGLGVKKGSKPTDTVKAVRAAVLKRFAQ